MALIKMEKKSLQKYKKEARREVGKKDEKDEGTSSYLKPETKHGVMIVVYFALALFLIFCLFGWAGVVGQRVKIGLDYLFGWGKYMVPIVFLVIVYLLFKPQKYVLRTINYIGFGILILSLTGFLNLWFSLDSILSIIKEGKGGGYVGLVLSYPLRKLVGNWAAGIILLALFIISLLITFDISLKRLYDKGNIFKRIIERFREFFYKIKVNLETKKEDVEKIEEKKEFEAEEAVKPVKAGGAKPTMTVTAVGKEEQLKIFPEARPIKRKIEIPIDLLESNHKKPTSGDIEANKERIQKTLRNFGIEVEMGEIKVGPTVTQYSLKPAEGVKLSQITTLHNDLALALAAHPIRIEAPIPGKSLVGVEVPNQVVAVVKLKEILASDEFKKRKTNLTIALGKDVAGHPWVANLDSMPHMLIAGATGSGKTVCINSIIISLLYQNSPSDLKLILVDPKRVELPVYNDIPYLMTPVVTEIDKIISVLRWVVAEMDRRFHVLSKSGKRNIQVYNQDAEEALPYIVLMVDELADLMAVAAYEVEGAIIRLAQMARAVGIHLILATQRPSVDVITGLIKANITTRIAFSVASIVDSRTILDNSGAEKLLGRGDMLYISSELSKPKRLQGAYVTDAEIERVVNYLKSKAQPEYSEEIIEKTSGASTSGEFDELKDDELLPQAKELILKTKKASASFLQRRMRIGYARAARLLDLLEQQGVIGPADGAKPREILIDQGSEEAGHDITEDVEEEQGQDNDNENNV